MSSIGAFVSAQINFSLLAALPASSKIYVQYGVISGLIFLIGMGYTCLCLKGGNDYYPQVREQRNFRMLLATAKQTFKNP